MAKTEEKKRKYVPRTEEEKRKHVEYNRRVYKVFAFKLHRSYDQDIIDYLDGIKGKRAYICKLLREDMERRKAND